MIEKEREIWSVEDFKAYVRKRIDKQYSDTASMIVLRSFYVANVTKEEGVKLRMFVYLRGIAAQEIKDYKSYLNRNNYYDN